MLLSLALSLTLAAPPASRLSYEAKCLYCHSESVAESRRMSEGQWRRLIERMRLKAPLLITRTDVPPLARFMVQTLKLGAAPKKVDAKPVEVKPDVRPVEVKPEPKPEPLVLEPTELEEPPLVEAPPPTPEDVELERAATDLISRRCSKCHTLGRVYGRLDTLERSLTTLERMRLKTGSGISTADVELLERYLRSQF
jgi:hypothetical protein